MSDDIEILTLASINIHTPTCDMYMIGETEPLKVDLPKEISFNIIAPKSYIDSIMNFPDLKIIRGILGDSLYILKYCMLKSYDITYGDNDIPTETIVTMDAKEVDIYDMNIKFKDVTHKVDALNFCLVKENYGKIEKMSYVEFCQKCLAVRI